MADLRVTGRGGLGTGFLVAHTLTLTFHFEFLSHGIYGHMTYKSAENQCQSSKDRVETTRQTDRHDRSLSYAH